MYQQPRAKDEKAIRQLAGSIAISACYGAGLGDFEDESAAKAEAAALGAFCLAVAEVINDYGTPEEGDG